MNTFVADPHWGWWIVWYFYLGGIAAGSYFMAALIDLVGDEHDRELGRVGYLLAGPLVAVCGVLLILDLSQPGRFWHMLLDAETLSPHLKYWSPMSIGAWALLLFGAISTISFLGSAAELGVPGLAPWASVAMRLHRTRAGQLFDLIGTVCGFFIASYTGALLTATNQPIWSNSPWIASLYLASSATTGISAVQLIGRAARTGTPASNEKLERADVGALLLELVTFAFFLGSFGSSLPELVTGVPFLLLLVGALGGGVCLPLVLRLWPKFPGSRPAIVAALLVLVGGFVLRYSLLAAAPAFLQAERAAAMRSEHHD